jgi:hypothetical protein
MKPLAILLLIVLIPLQLYSQQNKTPTREYYLKKSSDQRTAGWILLGGGTVLILAGISTGSGGNESELGYGSNFDSGMILFGVGLAADIISIPMFVKASKNKKRAEALVSVSPMPVVVRNTPSRVIPSISISIRL